MSSTCADQRLAPRHVRRAATSTSNTTSSPGKPSCRSQEPAPPLVKADIVNTEMLLIDLVEADAPRAANKPTCRHHHTYDAHALSTSAMHGIDQNMALQNNQGI